MSFIHWKPCQVCMGRVMALQKAFVKTLGALRALMLHLRSGLPRETPSRLTTRQDTDIQGHGMRHF